MSYEAQNARARGDRHEDEDRPPRFRGEGRYGPAAGLGLWGPNLPRRRKTDDDGGCLWGCLFLVAIGLAVGAAQWVVYRILRNW